MESSELKAIMHELRLTQRDVSEYLSVNIRTVRSWISGSKKMNGCAVVALRCTRYLSRVRVWQSDEDFSMFGKW
jgi:DNA-binding transcriptional regulator YiaG